MKKAPLFLTIFILALLLFSCKKEDNGTQILTDSIEMGPNYVNDIYYNIKDGSKNSIIRNNWDIAFTTNKRSSSILINSPAGITLKAYPKANIWSSTIDTAGYYSWKSLLNSDTTWEVGAFSANAKSHPNYGWGIYSEVTHELDSACTYIIKLQDNTFRKIYIKHKYSSLNKFKFRYANLNGSNDKEVDLDCTPYTTKNYIGYSLQTNQLTDRDPVTASWDIVFTQYMDVKLNYKVTGLLINNGVKIIKVKDVLPDAADYKNSTFGSNISTIGYDWKTVDMNTGSYTLKNFVFFIKNSSGDVYKLYITRFDGSKTGKVVFKKVYITNSI